MAEVAGLALSGIGLATLVRTITECFECVDVWRGFGKQYEHHALQLEIAKFALQRWRQSVNVLDGNTDPALMAQLVLASEEENELVRKLLGNIQLAFEEAEKSAKRYTPLSPKNHASSNRDQELVALTDRVRRACQRRQKSVCVTSKARWVLADAKTLQRLTDHVSRNVRTLVELFPGAALVTMQELRAIVDQDNVQILRLLQRTAEGVDTALEQKVTETLAAGCAPVWEDNVADGNSRVSYGDVIGSDYTGKIAGIEYRFVGNKAGGSAQVTYGTRYGSQYKEPFGSD